MEKEIRTLQIDTELRANKDNRTVEGYAIVFNSESRDLGGFVEVIRPEAIDGVLEESDILALLNHEISRGVLARAEKLTGSLNLEIRDKGVYYSFKAPKTALGEETIEGVLRGDIKGTSFGFTVAPNGDKIEKRADGSFLRTIKQFDKIYDISPVYRAAYSDTTIALRSLEQFKIDNPEPNPQGANTPGKDLEPPELTNAELALRARNERHKTK